MVPLSSVRSFDLMTLRLYDLTTIFSNLTYNLRSSLTIIVI
jgi:hypothetical protein